jgi:hypothetical protein
MALRLVPPLGLALAVTLVACHRERSGAPTSPCKDGSCVSNSECALGECMDGDVAELRRDHSPQAATLVENGAACPYLDGKLPPKSEVADDSDIPQFKRARSRGTNMDSGNAQPQDIDLHEHLMGVQGRIFECIDIAACYAEIDPFVEGELDFQFELEPTGKVSAVSVKPSPSLADPVVQACARRSLYEFGFPAWNGARMVVSYRLEIGESV